MKSALFFCFIFLLIACENTDNSIDQSSPENTVSNFLLSMKNGSFSEAKQFISPNSQNSFTDFETNLKMIGSEEKKTLLNAFDMEIKSINCQEVNGITNCSICCSDAGELTLEVISINDKWFIQTEFGY